MKGQLKLQLETENLQSEKICDIYKRIVRETEKKYLHRKADANISDQFQRSGKILYSTAKGSYRRSKWQSDQVYY